jgi:hypothetical protein
MASAAHSRVPDSDEQVRRRLARMSELRESGDRHARSAVSALRTLSAQLRRAQLARLTDRS